MTTLSKPHPLDLAHDLFEIRLHSHILRLVEPTINKQRLLDLNVLQLIRDTPSLQAPGYIELGRAVHGQVHRIIRLHLLDRIDEFLRERRQTADEALVEDIDRGLVLVRVGLARLLESRQRLLYVVRETTPQGIRDRDPRVHVRRTVGDDEFTQTRRLVRCGCACGECRGEHAAP